MHRPTDRPTLVPPVSSQRARSRSKLILHEYVQGSIVARYSSIRINYSIPLLRTVRHATLYQFIVKYTTHARTQLQANRTKRMNSYEATGLRPFPS